uniref:Uncharacterized protein n=1 Tax=Pipistrellus kuhlii TaxID=59472 RepID=A0A7J7YMC3_PIPKU|nr:hypothetical protein mPipKuh1_010108 [Pipistrellus kuhlii]
MKARVKEGAGGREECGSAPVLELIGQPVQSLIEPSPSDGRGGLKVPGPVMQRVQAQLVCDLSCVHGIGEVLLVCKHEQDNILHLSHHPHHLLSGLIHAFLVSAVNHKDETITVLAVVAPQRPDLVLAVYVPHDKADVLILHSLHVETYGGNGVHDLTQLQFVQDGGLPSSVQSHHE